ncbi:FAD dependent oxidoreductase, partial [Cryphonectria parasitica EP155]
MVLREVREGQSGLPVPNSTLSYWHKDPSPKLLNHRTTADLPATADTIIIGTGMTGSFAARFLKEAQPSSRLVMLEAREACWGATGRNGGHCQPFLYGTSPEVARFELETYFFLRDLVEREGVQCGWRSLPGVHAMLSEDVYEAAKEAVPRLREKVPEFADKIVAVGPDGVVRSLTLDTLRLNQPDVKGAIVQRYAASMWPYKLVCWVLETLLATHAPAAFNLQTNTAVTGVSRAADGRQWTVQTARGPITAPKVLLATNGYTSRLLPAFSDLIVPVRGQVGALLPPTEPRVGLDYSYVFFGRLKDEDDSAATRDEYLVQRPLPGGELILGGGRHLAKGMAVGEWHDDVVEERVAAWLRTELEPVLDLDGKEENKKRGLEAAMEWTGIMAYSRDQSPWVGPVPESLGGGEGLYIASGFTGHGMPRCALAGRGVARMMEGDLEGHGVPQVFLVGAERAEKAR